uniref:Uncharacterized protein n=1 Tax=Arundo donax TaxID=35708 RepID=A0A0A8ZMB2_ARUDO
MAKNQIHVQCCKQDMFGMLPWEIGHRFQHVTLHYILPVGQDTWLLSTTVLALMKHSLLLHRY